MLPKDTIDFWKRKRVLITGGAGFLGSHIVDILKTIGCKEIFVPRSKDYDLREQSAVKRMYEDFSPEIVIHLASVVGGIGANQKFPGKFFYDNAIMGIQVIEFARRFGVEKFVCIGTVCSYPKYTPIPFREEDLWNGYPEETNAPYGLAKKMLLVQLQAYRKEYGFKGIYLILTNLYGPRDNFDLETSHVIPALIRKFIEAKEAMEKGNPHPVVLWGTGKATREFLYVEDAAEGILIATHKYDGADPVNMGGMGEISIKDLAQMIKEMVRYKGEIIWDTSKPDGQPRRCLDSSKALKLFGWKAATPLEVGLRKTIEWYLQQRKREK
ncbi:GDP-L-fucose synthase [Candidatus Calescamantes bacterium]|nr:GDP-L-fucose synthase [Candidatus Calescamantes bacterium]